MAMSVSMSLSAADFSCLRLFCFCSSSPFSFPKAASFSRTIRPSSSSSYFLIGFPLFHSRPSSSRAVRSSAAKEADDGDFISNNPFHFYPWDSSSAAQGEGAGGAIHWVPEDRITLFTADGLIQIGGSLVPRQFPAYNKRGKASQRFQRFQERNYMDPNQGLCLGALFDIAATNGLDMGRRLCIYGFCRSIEMLSDVVEDTVLEHGGEVVAAEKASKGGLQEKLTMTLAVPLLWGVPPASETLHLAVQTGGGIVEKVYWQWDFL
ncbi:hypothetical protein CKAN_02073600 [Cinnamomum micranthum f. kanehirae]|uniref:DUF7811 domain-containing protein n=1 Tax=Cinnamomum micranthum f. kanehirae TaxID=337451 RepID=A0A443PLB6_9MAGN|nr:hypothetical protein CKAN_02073600 [Cinnamomum micranthum f. kanehirae]